MVAVTGMHRRTLIRLISSLPRRRPRRNPSSRFYSAIVEQLVRLVDRALDYPCRERLKPMLPFLADYLKALGLAAFSPETRQLLETISVSSVGRLLQHVPPQDGDLLSSAELPAGLGQRPPMPMMLYT